MKITNIDVLFIIAEMRFRVSACFIFLRTTFTSIFSPNITQNFLTFSVLKPEINPAKV